MKTSIKVLTSIRGEGGLTPIQETFECVTSGRVVHFDSTRKLPFQQRHFLSLLQKAEQLYNSYLDRRQFWNTTLQLGGIFGLKATFHFVDVRESHLMCDGRHFRDVAPVEKSFHSHQLMRTRAKLTAFVLLVLLVVIISSNTTIHFVWYQHDFSPVLCCHQPYYHF